MPPEDISLDGLEPTAIGELSPVMRALRFTSDEVQFGRVLAAVCDDPGVAFHFVTAVIEHARGGHPDALGRVSAVPSDIVCVDERVIRTQIGRRASRQRYRDAGRVDLDFAGGSGWRLFVELKLDSGFGSAQLERYSQDSPVAAIVRDAATVPELTANQNWVGATTWAALTPALRQLPLGASIALEWQSLVNVMSAQGEFAELARPNSPEIDDARELLKNVVAEVGKDFYDSVVRRHGADAEALASQLRPRRVAGGRGPWVGFAIGTREDGDWIWIEIRNLWSRAPRLRVWYYEYPDAWARHKNKVAHERLEAEFGFARYERQSWVLEESVPALASRDPNALRQEIANRLEVIVSTGVFALAIRRSR